MAGFEPARAKHNRLAADLLNHSDTLSKSFKNLHSHPIWGSNPQPPD